MFDSDDAIAIRIAIETALRQPRPVEVRAVPLTYAQGMRRALQQGKPLVVFIGCPVRPIAGAVVCQGDIETFGTNGIVVSDGKYWAGTYPVTATDAAIRGALGPSAVQQEQRQRPRSQC